MPWTTDNPPDVAKNWTDEEIERCVEAANETLADGGTDEEAVFACIGAAGKGKARGEGQGVGGPRQGDAGAEECVCPACGATVEHERGTPCNEVVCPECGTPMDGKSMDEKRVLKQEDDGGEITFGEPEEVEVAYTTKTLLGRIAQQVGRIGEHLFGKAAHVSAETLEQPLVGKTFGVIRDKAAGKRRWVGVVTSAFYPDRDGEGFTKAHLEEMVAYAREHGTPETKVEAKGGEIVLTTEGGPIHLDVWHVWPAVVDKGADLIAMCGPFVVASGLEANTKRSKAFFDYVEARQKSGDFDWRMSHLFTGAPDGEGLYKSGSKFLRFTTAPAEVVANLATAFGITTGGSAMKIESDEMRAEFVKIFGEDGVQEMEDELEDFAGKVHEAGYVLKVYKAEGEGEPAEEEPAEESDPEGEDEPDEDGGDEIAEVLEAALKTALAPYQERIEELTAKVRELESRQAEDEPSGFTWYPAGSPASEKTGQGAVNEAGIPMASPLKR